ncbi:MAG: hypothetical protein F4Z60_01430 [Chloroflexi bacterium]|nr:hypothetical protein [Chloroflexota bacterium]
MRFENAAFAVEDAHGLINGVGHQEAACADADQSHREIAADLARSGAPAADAAQEGAVRRKLTDLGRLPVEDGDRPVVQQLDPGHLREEHFGGAFHVPDGEDVLCRVDGPAVVGQRPMAHELHAGAVLDDGRGADVSRGASRRESHEQGGEDDASRGR